MSQIICGPRDTQVGPQAWLNTCQVIKSMRTVLHEDSEVESADGDQDMPPQNVALWHKNHFELNAFELWEPLICLKAELPPKNSIVRYPFAWSH